MAILPLVRLLLLAAGASALQLYTEEESFAVDPSAGAHATESASASPQKKTHKKHSNHSKSDVKKHHRKGKTQKTAEKEQGATNSAVKSVAHQKTSGGVVAAPTATQQKSSHSSKAVTTAEKSSHSSKAVTTVEKTSHSSKAATTAGKSSHSSKEVTTAEKKHSTVSNRTKKSKTGVHKKEAGNVTAPKQEASSKQDTSAAKTSSQQQGKDSIVQKVVKEKPATPVKTITAEATAPAGETTRHVPGASVVKHMSAAAQTATHGGLAAVGNLAHRAAQVVHSAKDGASKAIGAVAHGASMVKDGAAKAKNEAIGAVAHGASIVKDGATKAKTEAIGAVAHGASIVKDGAAKAKTEAIGAVAHGASMVADEAKQTAAGVRSSVSHIFQSPRVAADESHDNAGDDVEPSNATQVADAKRVENDASAEKADSEKATPVADSAANTTAGIDNATKPTSGVPTGDAPHAAREKVTAVAGDVKNATSVVTTSESTRGTNKVLEKGAQKQTPLVGAKKMIPHIPADQVPRIADEPEEAPHMEEEMDDIEVTKHEEHGGKSSLATTGAGSKLQEQIHGLKSHLHELIHEGQKKVAKKRAEYEKSLAEQHANTTEIRRTNKRLADEIEWISLQNTKLWERSRALRSQAIELRQDLSDFRNNMSVAQEFIEASIEHGSDNEKLQVLTELSMADEHVRKERAREEALRKMEVAKVALVQFGDHGDGDAMDHVNVLDKRFDELEREQKASLEALRGEYEKSWEEESHLQDRLMEEQRDLERQKADQLARNDKLKSAVQHLEHTTAQLQKMLHGLKHFSTGLGGQ